MPRDLANFIDALIPGIAGLAIILFPSTFAGKNPSVEKLKKIKMIGFILVAVSIGYVILKLLSHS
jgi:hypothetical protein